MELLVEILTSAFWIILAITILVFIHELGHFLSAKLFGMRVERFSVGFPPKLFGRTVGDTEYVVGATPLGGYVKISGMIDESMDTDYQQSEPKPWEFRSKPVWQRIVVITAGVIFNVILAAIIFSGLKITYGETYIPAENIESVYVDPGSVAYEMGLRTGDRITAVNGNPVEQQGDLRDMSALLADTLTVTVQRDGQQRTFKGPEDIMTQVNRAGGGLGIDFLPPLVGGVQGGSPADQAGLRPGDRILSVSGDSVRFWMELSNRIQATGGDTVAVRWRRPDSLQADTLGAGFIRSTPEGGLYQARLAADPSDDGERYLIGIQSPSPDMLAQEFGVRKRTYGPGEALVAGAEQTWVTGKNIVVSLKRIITGRDNLRENLGGPVMVAQITQQAAEAGPDAFWNIVALLSITLAIMNILPIPALDGGQLVFLLYEGITRRKPSVRVRMAAQQIGMILLIGLMAFLIFNDILRL
jgi:regulator of sigma E protease